MSEEKDILDEIEARANAATDGPWCSPLGIFIVNNFQEDPLGEFKGSNNGNNTRFIAHARTDVPNLCRALRAVLDLCDSSLAIEKVQHILSDAPAPRDKP